VKGVVVHLKTSVAAIVALIVATAVLAAEPPTPEQLIETSIAAHGGREAFLAFGVLKLEVQETETKLDGTVKPDSFTAYVDTSLRNSRLEMANGVVVVKNDKVGWATINGKLDQRNQTPRFSVGLNHEKAFPILLPFTLDMEGLVLGTTTTAASFAGENAWSFTVGFEKMFFVAPFIADMWELYFAQDDGQFLGARFLPRPEFLDVHPEGVQYTVVASATVDGVILPTQILMDGIDSNGVPTGHVSVVKITSKPLYEPGIAYFLHPEKLAALEDGESLLD
jgi:hypothetical protein